MQLEDLKVGVEYYTARDDYWASGRPSTGRMRVLSVKPVREYGSADQIRCELLDVHTGEVVKRDAEPFLNGFRGTWAEVGAPLYARYGEWVAWARVTDASYRKALALAVGMMQSRGVPARIAEDRGQRWIEITPVFPAMLSGLFKIEE